MGYSEDQSGTFSGSKRVGKDEFAHVARKAFGADTIAFADSLKLILSAMYKLNIQECERNKHDPVYEKQSWRQLCEIFGCDFVRDQLSCNDIWIKKVEQKLDRLDLDPVGRLITELFDVSVSDPSFDSLYNYAQTALDHSELPILPQSESPLRIVVVTDVRFFGEYEMLRKRGAIMVQIRRTLANSKQTGHVSDTYDDRMQPSIIITNDGTLDEFHTKVHATITGIRTSFQ